MQPEIYSSLTFKQLESFSSQKCDTKLCSNSKKISKKRTRYRRIDDDIRQKLIDAVLKDGQMLKTVKQNFPSFSKFFKGCQIIPSELFFCKIYLPYIQKRSKSQQKNVQRTSYQEASRPQAQF